MSKENDYYLVIDGTQTHKHIAEFISERVKAHESRKAFQESFGADGTYGTESHFDGIVYKRSKGVPVGGEALQGWGIHKASDSEHIVFTPDKKTKRGKELAKKMASEEFIYPGCMNFHTRMFPFCNNFGVPLGPSGTGTGFRVGFANYDILGGKYILIVPRNGKGETEITPGDDCKPLKQSEYWAMKESSEQKKAA